MSSVRWWGPIVVLAAAIWLVTNGCGIGDDAAPEPAAEPQPTASASATGPRDDNPDLLSAWAQVTTRDGVVVLGERVVPYSLNSALFSDHAHKLRTVQVPEDADPAGYDPDDVFTFPVGTVITKTFYYPVDGDAPDGMRVLRADPDPTALDEPLDLTRVRLIETRVLVLRADGWHALPYVWNDDGSEAVLQRIGDLVPLTLVDDGDETPFTYVVPDANQCANCHATNHTTGAIQPIGPAARHLNRDVDLGDGLTAQLVAWRDLGLIDELPPVDDIPAAAAWQDDSAPLEDRARAYLDINCAHCHNREGPADTSGLFLEADTEPGTELGVCKAPIAAGSGTGGRRVGIAPGLPDESIFVYRMESTDPAEMMPEIGRSLVHAEGVALVSEWIRMLTGSCS